jgi:hypothetical protein
MLLYYISKWKNTIQFILSKVWLSTFNIIPPQKKKKKNK